MNVDHVHTNRFLAASPATAVIVLDDNCQASTCPNFNIAFTKDYAGGADPGAQADASQGCYEETVTYELRDDTDPEFDCVAPIPERHLLLRRSLAEGEVPPPECPSGGTVDFCAYQGPGSLPWKDNCSAGGNVDGQAVDGQGNPSGGPDECAETAITHKWTGPSDDCGNQADDKVVTITVGEGEATYTSNPDGGNVDCGAALPEVTIKKALCGPPEDFQVFPSRPTTPDETCGDVKVGEDIKGTCGEDLSVTFTIVDTDPPVFQCKPDSCPGNANVCSVPSGGELCASDCQYANLPNQEKCVDPTDEPASIDVCAGGSLTRTWSTGKDGCNDAEGDTVAQALTVPAQGPGAPTKQADPAACGGLPTVCVDVPKCVDGATTTEQRCASASDSNGFVFGTPSAVTGCSGSSATRTVDVTYTDPTTMCAKSTVTPGVSYSDKCCCKSDTAYVQNPPQCFTTLGANSNNWGWYFGPYPKGNDFSTPLTLDIGAGRAGCDLLKGYKAGTATINYTGSQLTVMVTADSGVTFSSVEIWVGATQLPPGPNNSFKFSPGQFNNKYGPFNPAVTTFTTDPPITVTANTFYFAIHLNSQRTTTCST